MAVFGLVTWSCANFLCDGYRSGDEFTGIHLPLFYTCSYICVVARCGQSRQGFLLTCRGLLTQLKLNRIRLSSQPVTMSQKVH